MAETPLLATRARPASAGRAQTLKESSSLDRLRQPRKLPHTKSSARESADMREHKGGVDVLMPRREIVENAARLRFHPGS
jgi:hypothetical protein